MAELTDEIRERRRGGLGGSDAPQVFDLGYGSTFSLWADKVWGSKDSTNQFQQRGHDLEPLIGEKAAQRHGITDLFPGGWVDHPTIPWMFSNLDYTAEDGATLIECKAMDWQWGRHEWGDDGDPEGVPASIEIQGRHQMECTGAERCIIAVMFVDQWDFRTYELKPDADITDMILAGERAFWHDHVVAQVPPPVTDGPSAWDALRQLCSTPDRGVDLDEHAALVEEFVTVRETRLAAATHEKDLKAKIARLMADAELGRIADQIAVTFKASGNNARSLSPTTPYRKQITNGN